VSDYATDLTMLTDLQTGPDGNLYAVSMGEFTEQGPVPSSGAVLRIGEGTTSEAILTGLSFPTGLAFASNGDAYVTVNGMGAPGSGQVLKYVGLAGGM
jgi:sugar lactone lactonase YvrE